MLPLKGEIRNKCLTRARPAQHQDFSSSRRDSMVLWGLEILHLECEFLQLQVWASGITLTLRWSNFAFTFKFLSIKMKNINGLSMHCAENSLIFSVVYTSCLLSALHDGERRQINHFIFCLCSQYVNRGLQLLELTTPKENIHIHSSKRCF